MTLDEYMGLPFPEQMRLRYEYRARKEGVTVEELRRRVVETLTPTKDDDADTLRAAVIIWNRCADEEERRLACELGQLDAMEALAWRLKGEHKRDTAKDGANDGE